MVRWPTFPSFGKCHMGAQCGLSLLRIDQVSSTALASEPRPVKRQIIPPGARHAKLGLYALATNNPKAFKIGLTTRAFSQRAREWARQCPSEGFQLIYGVNIRRRHLRIAERNARRKMRTISIPTYRKLCKDCGHVHRELFQLAHAVDNIQGFKVVSRLLRKLGRHETARGWGQTVGARIEVLSMFLDNKIDEDCLLRLPPTPKSEYLSSFFAPMP
ncbi:hypothetical protein D9758_017356 [Tetrapyrgos nigripes]|uniref:Bacteriophage T5 Orf172 DNA-binding domain-containing protein n=1 Tax=Tetrapyrgos nigripes TaxID=182062 RepID=A0A8H5C3S6_9AGAR|nr:hypothetical protein D9758_017356 [Tetrapyrgos nigripes]